MPSLIGRCGGGGITRWCGVYSGAVGTAGAGGQALFLTWDTLEQGDAVLTLGGAGGPAVNKTGNWAITAVVAPTLGGGFAVGDTYYAQFDVADSDPTGAYAESAFNSGIATATHPTPPVTLAVTLWLTSGSTFTTLVVNGAGGAANFELTVGTVTFLGGS